MPSLPSLAKYWHTAGPRPLYQPACGNRSGPFAAVRIDVADSEVTA